jgi:hypothetical protein
LADLTVQETSKSGLAPTFTAADSVGDTFANFGNAFLHVKNGSAASITVTIDSIMKCDQGFDHDLSVNVAASGEEMIGPFIRRRFNNDQHKVSVSYSDVTSVTVAAIKVGD